MKKIKQMSDIKYGLISDTDARFLEKTIDLLLSESDDININVLEVGCYGGDTGKGIFEYIFSKKRIPIITGIDNNKDGEKNRFKYDKLIIGDSSEVYNQLEDNSQHLIFIDGCHCFAHVISDFFCYAGKVKKGCFIAFHDTGKHINTFNDFQHGCENNPDAYISVRKALNKIGLLNDKFDISSSYIHHTISRTNWDLIFDEADETNEAGGVTVFKKL